MKELSNIELDTIGRIKNFVRKMKTHKKANVEIEALTKGYFEQVTAIIEKHSKENEADDIISKRDAKKQIKLEYKKAKKKLEEDKKSSLEKQIELESQ